MKHEYYIYKKTNALQFVSNTQQQSRAEYSYPMQNNNLTKKAQITIIRVNEVAKTFFSTCTCG